MERIAQKASRMRARMPIYLDMAAPAEKAEPDLLLVATARAVVAMERENILEELWRWKNEKENGETRAGD